MVPADDALPPEVQAQVDKIKAEEGGDSPAAESELESVEVAVPERPLSRKQQAEKERAEQFRAVEERATKAAEIAERLAQQRQEDAQRLARMEEMLSRGYGQQQVPAAQTEQTQASGDKWRDKFDKFRRKADEALAAGKLDDYHRYQDKATEIKTEAMVEGRLQQIQQRAPQTQQQFRAPDWVTAVESQFADVVMHPSGKNVVAAIAQMEMAKTGRAPDAQMLMAAYGRARTELGLGKQSQEPTEKQRQVLNGGPVNGSGRAAPAGDNRAPKVLVPSNWRQIARANRMTDEQYLANAKAMQDGK